MKKRLALWSTVLVSILLVVSTPALANPGVFLGVTYNFGGGIGVSLKVLSTKKECQGSLVAGVSYFPLTQKFGLDAGAAYLFRNGGATLSWDFLNSSPQVGAGYVNTTNCNSVVLPPPPVQAPQTGGPAA